MCATPRTFIYGNNSTQAKCILLRGDARRSFLPPATYATRLLSVLRFEAMGICQSTEDPLGGAAFGAEGEPCPTVFELERIIEERRGAASRLHVNLVNIEFRRSLFEVYCRGAPDEESDQVEAGRGGGGGGSGGGGGGGGGGSDGEPADSIAMVGNVAAAAAAAERKKAETEMDMFVATHKVSDQWVGSCDVHKLMFGAYKIEVLVQEWQYCCPLYLSMEILPRTKLANNNTRFPPLLHLSPDCGLRRASWTFRNPGFHPESEREREREREREIRARDTERPPSFATTIVFQRYYTDRSSTAAAAASALLRVLRPCVK